ncbi:class I SAM-dependent methyltransferase [Archangium violaceum]|uniref:class I SAM-dependent methyltransferase n=1 Tax=Archangium violaceum TaxID=83451 RepID=UPI00194E1DDB|nr:class I SAM-dependent methyltransferase [Archangium violaceum]QRO01510.1 class I SAM-dependent methyltransferase [Archangium violaceum]
MKTNKHSTEFDWAATRGEKWRARLDGMERMLAPIDAPLIHALRLDGPVRIADVACGGGGTTLEILRRAPEGSIVDGFDISPGLIETARARIPPDERAISFTRVDVATTPPPGGPYERLTSRFGVMFFDDAPAAFRNLAGWLAPGGRFAFAVWGRPADNPWVTTVRDVVAGFVDVPPSDPDAPGPFRYGQADTLLKLLRQAGFGEVEVSEWREGLAIGGGLGAADAADFALAAFSIAEPLAKTDDVVRGNARRALTERFSRHLRDGVVRLDARVNLVTGQVCK